jgi:outer membrane protein assembly factor BamB
MTLTTRAHAVVLSVVVGLLIGGHARAQEPDRASDGGTIVWEDVFVEAALSNDVYYLNAVVGEGRSVFAAGSGPYHDGPTIRPYVIIRAYDADTGTLLWQTTRTERDEELEAFGVDRGRVFAAGTASYSRCCFSYLVRAYDSSTGSVLWEERLGQCAPGACPDPARATDLAAEGGRVVVGGCRGSSGSGSCFLRAYDGATGTVLWVTSLPGSSFLFPRVLAREGRVFALTGVFDSASNTVTHTLHAYDASNGSLLWEVVLPESASFRAPASAVGPNRVFVAGSALVRAYDVATGELLWDMSGASAPAQMIVQGELLFAVGDSVRAYDTATGTLRWEDQQKSVALNAVTTQGDQVFAAGSYAPGASYPDQGRFFLVLAYDARTGALLWDNRQPSPTPNTAIDAANAVAAAGGRVFAGGIQQLYRASTTQAWHLRAYNAVRADPPAFNSVGGTYNTP